MRCNRDSVRQNLVVAIPESLESDCREPWHTSYVVDAKDPANPRIIGLFPRPKPHPDAPYNDFAVARGRFSSRVMQHWIAPGKARPDIVALSYLNAGLRLFDISDPTEPKEVAYFVPPRDGELDNYMSWRRGTSEAVFIEWGPRSQRERAAGSSEFRDEIVRWRVYEDYGSVVMVQLESPRGISSFPVDRCNIQCGVEQPGSSRQIEWLIPCLAVAAKLRTKPIRSRVDRSRCVRPIRRTRIDLLAQDAQAMGAPVCEAQTVHGTSSSSQPPPTTFARWPC
jgi:hypothetical protein